LKESLGALVAKEMCFQRSSEGIEGKSRPPQSGWKRSTVEDRLPRNSCRQYVSTCGVFSGRCNVRIQRSTKTGCCQTPNEPTET